MNRDQEQKERYDMLAEKLAQSHHYHTETTLMKTKEHEMKVRDQDQEYENRLTKE